MDETAERPPDASETEFLPDGDADGNTVMVVVPDDPSKPVMVGAFEGGPGSEPSYCFALTANQAIDLGQQLLKAGVRKQVIRQIHGVSFGVEPARSGAPSGCGGQA